MAGQNQQSFTFYSAETPVMVAEGSPGSFSDVADPEPEIRYHLRSRVVRLPSRETRHERRLRVARETALRSFAQEFHRLVPTGEVSVVSLNGHLPTEPEEVELDVPQWWLEQVVLFEVGWANPSGVSLLTLTGNVAEFLSKAVPEVWARFVADAQSAGENGVAVLADVLATLRFAMDAETRRVRRHGDSPLFHAWLEWRSFGGGKDAVTTQWDEEVGAHVVVAEEHEEGWPADLVRREREEDAEVLRQERVEVAIELTQTG